MKLLIKNIFKTSNIIKIIIIYFINLCLKLLEKMFKDKKILFLQTV